MSKKRFGNKRAIQAKSEISIKFQHNLSKIKVLVSFNFKFFDKNQTTNIHNLNETDFKKLFQKIEEYSKESPKKWEQDGVSNNRYGRLAIYGSFPDPSKLNEPSFTPTLAFWARFRMDSSLRLGGFFLQKVDNAEKLDPVFYVVFYDENHEFYLPGKSKVTANKYSF